jgi:thioredoxin-dependent peroxiredoxin
VRDEIGQYEQQNVRPFGVNPASVDQHAAYAGKLGLPFPLLSDANRAIARAYHALNLTRGISRSVYLIDRGGTILFSAPGAPGAEISLESLGGS